MKKILVLIICLLVFMCIPVFADTSVKEVKFVKCVDGDTAVFTVDNEDVKYRFLAIDTPESVHPTKEVQEFGKDASEYTCNKLTNAKSIYVEYENGNKKDKYGRSLAWIWVDGSLLQKELVDVGYAEVAYIYGKYKYTESLCYFQQEAKSKAYGIWNDGSREEGYCSTIDTSSTVSNITFPDGSSSSTDKTVSNNKDIKKVEEANNNIEKVNELLTNFLDGDSFDKVAVVIIVIIGAAISLSKSKKRK